MNKQEATALIRTTFEKAFDETQYLRFLRELFNGQIDESDGRKFDLYGQYIPDSFKDYVRRYKRLGTYTDPDGHEIDLLLVILRRDSSLDRARTMQRNFAAHHLKRRDKETALIAYTTEDRGDWRFSMVRREPVVAFSEAGKLLAKDELTPVRRYSFLVGANERSHTAQQQFFPILLDDKHDPTLDRLEDAFNIETVTQEFFERYKARFLQLKEELDRLTTENNRLQTEFQTKALDTANFAKKLLGQIVFLYFLQKKGWLGVQEGEPWGTGPRNFLHQLFKEASYNNFFNDVLEPLFYEALAIERPDNLYPRLKTRIPFLNGGLFEPMNNYDWQNTALLIDNNIFKNIFEDFDLYNFTVREDEPLEKEVAVDPEMLGKVFENLLDITDRKSKGAFYTPREIVHYMCQESLINYLTTTMGDTIPRDDIATFIRLGEFAKEHDTTTQAKAKETEAYSFRMPESIRTHATQLDEALANIKICDPAIGSGAFPVGMMQEIIKAREVLTTYIAEDASRTTYNFKRQAIQESIYGVDIDPGAIDIAKLRLWLSLVVDEDDYHHIKPLPNLDYKIVCGNSLLSVQRDLFNNDLFKQLEKLKADYFDETNPQEKQKQRAEIDVLITQLTGDHSQFDMQIYFSEVFHGNMGFDAVIANPPYVRQERIKEYKNDLKKLYPDVYAGTADLFVYFYAQGFNILKKQGVLAYITPNKFTRANYGKELRTYLATKTQLQILIDFDDIPVFDATTYPMIIVARKQSPDDNKIKVLEVKSLDAISTLYHTVDRAYLLPQNLLTKDGWQLSPPEIRAVMDKIKASGKILDDYVNGSIFYGIKTGLNDAFIIDEQKRIQLISADPKSTSIIKPYLRGRDIKRWMTQFAKLYIIAIQNSIDTSADNAWGKAKTENIALKVFGETYPSIYTHMMQYEKKLHSRADQGKWFWELRPCAYYEEFERRKITWGNLATQPQFAIAEAGTYINAPATFITIEDESKLNYLLGILNSKITQFFIASTGATRQGGFIEYKPMYVSQMPIAEATPDRRLIIQTLVEYILYIKRNVDTKSTAHARDAVMVSYFEQIIDALVYELYFPEEIHSTGRNFMSLLQQENLPPIADDADETQIRVLRQLFERLFKTDHPLRQSLFFLDSLELVRIIEGKA